MRSVQIRTVSSDNWGQVLDGLPKVHGSKQVEAGSQGPIAWKQRDSKRKPESTGCFGTIESVVIVLLGSEGQWQVASDSPGYSWDAGVSCDLQGKAGENGQPGSCLCKSGLQETVGYAGRKLPAGVANDWVTRRSSKLQPAE